MEGKVQDPKAEVQQYLEKSKIHELLEALLADLIYNKPADPKKYIVMQLEKIKVAGTRPLLDKEDLHTMFHMFDATSRGVVTEDQAKSALRTVLGSRTQAAAADTVGSAPLGQEDFVAFMDSALVAATPFCRSSADGSSS